MPRSRTMLAPVLMIVLLASACSKQPESPLDKAVENTKDALQLRDNEKLKDAAEEASEAVKDAGQGLQDAAQEAADKLKEKP